MLSVTRYVVYVTAESSLDFWLTKSSIGDIQVPATKALARRDASEGHGFESRYQQNIFLIKVYLCYLAVESVFVADVSRIQIMLKLKTFYTLTYPPLMKYSPLLLS